MKRKILKVCKNVFWKLPMPSKTKENLRKKYATRKDQNETDSLDFTLASPELYEAYIRQVLSLPSTGQESLPFEEHTPGGQKTDIIAYYLTQYHPNPQNDAWWGKGTTEWTNVSKAVPQFGGHYQPRLPGELGYYDLRLRENMQRQIELAKNYGVNVFCFYYYDFDGERLLERPLDMFFEDKSLDMRYCLCWANENWTKRFSGTDTDVLMAISDTPESNTRFIQSLLKHFGDPRYYQIDNKPVLVIYRPSNIGSTAEVLRSWREIAKRETGKDLYIIAVQEKGDNHDWCKEGYDAETEFQPKRIINGSKDITESVKPLRRDFRGTVYDYRDIVENRRYLIKENTGKKVYPAVMPMWDNTARRNHNAQVFHGATPDLYKTWLKDSIGVTDGNTKTEANAVFINAWNEWGEGAYLEPDRRWGYAYLQATYEALRETGMIESGGKE